MTPSWPISSALALCSLGSTAVSHPSGCTGLPRSSGSASVHRHPGSATDFLHLSPPNLLLHHAPPSLQLLLCSLSPFGVTSVFQAPISTLVPKASLTVLQCHHGPSSWPGLQLSWHCHSWSPDATWTSHKASTRTAPSVGSAVVSSLAGFSSSLPINNSASTSYTPSLLCWTIFYGVRTSLQGFSFKFHSFLFFLSLSMTALKLSLDNVIL